VPTCAQCHEENPEQSRYCGACGAPLVRQAGDAPEVRKVVTIVFCDVAGSTALGERVDPEALRATMSRYFTRMRSIIERHGGLVEKYIGDAVMAVFGLPLHEDDALRAVRAAVEMRGELERLGIPARIGLNTGEVVAHGRDTLVTGDAVNVAARLQETAERGDVVVGAATYALVRHAVRAEPLAPFTVKGKPDPIGAWRVLAVDEAAQAMTRELDRAFVGRRWELGALEQAFARAVEQRRSVLATVLGFPGIGKSRLLRELSRSIGSEAAVLVGHCLAYGEGITYAPLREMLRDATGDDVVRGVSSLLGDRTDGQHVADVVGAAIGERDMRGSGDEVFWAVRTTVEALAGATPVMLAFEDVHWAEPTLLDLIEYLADWILERPVLLVCLARPELLDVRPGWGGGKPSAISLTLDALPPAEVERMLEERGVRPELRARIAAAAQGVPLFVEQMALLLNDRDAADAGDVPPAIRSLLAARLEALAARDRTLLERASVEGERFHAGAIAAQLDEAPPVVLERLGDLVRRAMLQRDDADFEREHAFRFAHALIRDAAYERVSKAERARLHERLADWLDGRGAADEVVGYHLEQAVGYSAQIGSVDDRASAVARRASSALAAAGRRAVDRGDFPAAANLLERAAALLPTADHDRLDLLVLLGFVWSEIDIPRAEPVLAEALRLARETGNRRVEWASVAVRSRVALYADPTARPIADVLAEAERATRELEAAGDEAGVMNALIARTDVHWMRGELTRCDELCARAVRREPSASTARAFGYAASNLPAGPRAAADAAARQTELLALAGGNRVAVAIVEGQLGWLEAMQGRVADGRRRTRAARDLLEQYGNAEWAGIITLNCGYVELLDGDAGAAEAEFARAGRIFVDLGDAWFLSTAVVDHALALCELGRHAEALERSERPEAPYDSEWVIKWNQARALASLGLGRPGEALAHADAAVAAAERTEWLLFHANALADRATVFESLGRHPDAIADLEAALARYERKGNAVSAARVAARLDAAKSTSPR
jgi:class 3 adenylate cyclase/tetratricopeptide (TPR) repeat protein